MSVNVQSYNAPKINDPREHQRPKETRQKSIPPEISNCKTEDKGVYCVPIGGSICLCPITPSDAILKSFEYDHLIKHRGTYALHKGIFRSSISYGHGRRSAILFQRSYLIKTINPSTINVYTYMFECFGTSGTTVLESLMLYV